MQITLAKALKLKKRLSKNVAKLDAEIARTNLTLVDNKEFESNVRDLLKLRHKTAEDIVALKMAIYKANGPIQHDIFVMAEIRGLMAMVQRLNTSQGVVVNGRLYGGNGDKLEYKAQLSANDVTAITVDLERKVDELQDKVDAHNATTKIEVALQTIE